MELEFPFDYNSYFNVINELCELIMYINREKESINEIENKTIKKICQISVHSLNEQCEEYRKEILRHIMDIKFRKIIDRGISISSPFNLTGDSNAYILRMDQFSSFILHTGVNEYFYLLLLFNEIFIVNQRTTIIMENAPKLISSEWMFVSSNRHLRLLNRDVIESYVLIMYPSCIHSGFVARNQRLSLKSL